MTHIAFLDLSFNNITTLSGLESLLTSSLVSLAISDNPITDISILRKGTHLYDLKMVNDLVEDITPLSAMPALAHVTIGGKKLEDVTTLGQVKHLRTLHIQRAPLVTDVSCLLYKPTIVGVDFRDTGIPCEVCHDLCALAIFNYENQGNRHDTLFQILNRWYLKIEWDEMVGSLSFQE